MNAGKLRHLVSIQRLTGARDTTGAEMQTWTEYAKAYVWIEPYVGSARAGREVFTAGQLVGLDYTRIHLRFIPGISPKDQVIYSYGSVTRTFDILAINNRDERNYELELIAKERQTSQ